MTAEPQPTGPAYVYRAEAVRVIDGDTLVVNVDLGFHVGRIIKVRLRGFDAPERNEPGWADAAERLAYAVFPYDQGMGRHSADLVLRSYHDRRSFERWVCDLWRVEPDGSLRPINELLSR